MMANSERIEAVLQYADLLEKNVKELVDSIRANPDFQDADVYGLKEQARHVSGYAMSLRDRIDMLHDDSFPNLSLAQLYERLHQFDPDAEIVFEDGASPDNYLHSYRGYHRHAAIGIARGRGANPPAVLVNEMLHGVHQAINNVVYGYKGGEFQLYPEVPVWYADYGDASEQAIVDVQERDGKVVLVSQFYRDY